MNLANKIVVAVTAVTIITFSCLTGKWLAASNATLLVKQEILQRDEAIANYVAENLWKAHQGDLLPLFPLPLSEWEKQPKFLRFAKEFFDYLATLPYIEVKLLRGDGTAFVTSSSNAIIEDKRRWLDATLLFMDNDTLINQASHVNFAKSGVPYARLIPNAIFYTNDNRQLGELAHSLIPIRNQQGQVELIISLTSDFRSAWDLASHTGDLSAVVVAVSLMSLASVLLMSMVHTHKIISKQQEANAELVNAAKRAESIAVAKSQFLANVSHELRTPLNAIIGFSEIIKNQELGPIGNPRYAEYINDIHNSGTHLLALINDILDYTKAEAEKLKVDGVDVDVTHLARACLRVVAPKAEEAKVELIESMPKSTVIISADPKRFKQVMLNLLSNAIKFTPEKGKVRLVGTIDCENNRILIQVIDTGIGIAPENISKALATFEQIDNAHSRKYEGTGLGLPLTKKLVELMKGKFHLQSESGLGTTVSLTFPIKETIENGSAQGNEVLEVTAQPVGPAVQVAAAILEEQDGAEPESEASFGLLASKDKPRLQDSNAAGLDIENEALLAGEGERRKDVGAFLQDSNAKASSLGRPEWRIASIGENGSEGSRAGAVHRGLDESNSGSN